MLSPHLFADPIASLIIGRHTTTETTDYDSNEMHNQCDSDTQGACLPPVETFFRGEVLSLLLLSLFIAMEPLMAAGEGSFSDPPLPDPWVPGCIKA